MELSKNCLENINKLTICPNNTCENIPKIEYIEDIFYLLINCDKHLNESKKIMDINDYMNLFSNKLINGHFLKKIQYLNEFYFCHECKTTFDNKYIAQNHSNNHSIYNFNYKSYYNYCLEHIKKYNIYCQNCKTSLCESCKQSYFHYNHNINNLEEISPDKNKLEKMEKIIETQENLLAKVKDIVNECFIKFENDIKLKKMIIENYLEHKRNYNSIDNVNNLFLNINEVYKAKLEDLIDNDPGKEKLKTCDYTKKMLSIIYYYIMNQNEEKENKILNIIRRELNLLKEDNNYLSNNKKNYAEDNKGCNSIIKSSKLILKHYDDISKTIKNIIEDKVITSVSKLKSGNLILGFRNGLIKIYNLDNLCSPINGNEEILLIDNVIKQRKISCIYELNDNTLLCSTYSKIHKIKLKNNDTQYEIISKINLQQYEYPKKIIELGKELIVCLTQRNKKIDDKKMIECYIRIFKLNESEELDEEIGFLSDFDNEIIYNNNEGFASDLSSLDDEFQSYENGGIIDTKIKLYKKNIIKNSKYICTIFPTIINNCNKNNEYLYEFIATSNDKMENSNGENKIYFYGVNKTSGGQHRLNFIMISEITEISCSQNVDSICKINNNLIGVGIEKHQNKFAECAIIDFKKKELKLIIGNNSTNYFNISDNKNFFICSMNIKEEGYKNIDSIKYITIEKSKKDGKNSIEFKRSKFLLSFKNQFSNLIELKPKNISYNNDLFFGVFTGQNIFIIKIDKKKMSFNNNS